MTQRERLDKKLRLQNDIWQVSKLQKELEAEMDILMQDCTHKFSTGSSSIIRNRCALCGEDYDGNK